MIESIYFARMWVRVHNAARSVTADFHLPRRDVVAQASLSKVDWDSDRGSRYAKAYIRNYTVYVAYPDATGGPPFEGADEALSVVRLHDPCSVTFELTARADGRYASMYAYATALVFVHSA